MPPQDLFNAAKSVLKNAYAPYSRFQVAAAIRTASGNLFVGCNVENAAFSLTSCAETAAVTACIAQGQKIITEILILVDQDQICPPCGACRQRLLEFSQKDLCVHLCTLKNIYAHFTLEQLLPHAFNSNNLEKKL